MVPRVLLAAQLWMTGTRLATEFVVERSWTSTLKERKVAQVIDALKGKRDDLTLVEITQTDHTEGPIN